MFICKKKKENFLLFTSDDRKQIFKFICKKIKQNVNMYALSRQRIFYVHQWEKEGKLSFFTSDHGEFVHF